MAQKPIKKVKLQAKASKYKKVLARPKTDSQKVTKEIDKRIVEEFESKYKATNETKKKSKNHKKDGEFVDFNWKNKGDH